MRTCYTNFRQHKYHKQKSCKNTARQKQLTPCHYQRPQNATAETSSITSFSDVRVSDVTEAHTQPQHSCLHYPLSLTHAAHTTMPHGAARPVVRSQAVVLDKTPSCCAAPRYARSDEQKRNDLPLCARPARARQAAGRRGFDLLAVPRSPCGYRSDVTMTS